MYYQNNIPEFLKDFIANTASNNFEYVLRDMIDCGKFQVGNRKVILPVTVKFNGKEYDMTFNKTDGCYKIWGDIVKTIFDKDYRYIYNTYYHSATSLKKSAEVEDLFNRISRINVNNGYLNIVVDKSEDKSSEFNKIIDSFKYYIDQDNQDQENQNNINPDFSNYLDHIENNADKVSHEVMKYYSMLLEKIDELKLDKYIRFELKLDRGTTYKTILNGNLPFATEIVEWIKTWMKQERDIIGIVPEIGNWNKDNFYSINLLSFRFIYTDNHYAVRKHLYEVESEGISNYYASKKSGDYVGD